MLNDQQKQRVRDVFEIVAESESDDRIRLLDETCQGDEEVRRQVEVLLGLLPKAGEFLEAPVMSNPDIFREIAESLAHGRRIGNYEILEEIGHGGMGAVFLAVRADEDFRNQVAIKLVWPIFDNQEVISRFRQERRILANLSHQNIAHLIDGGTTEEGWPYLVMEYIDGVPITEYCDRLSVTDRLKLFRQVCDAVSYAHGHQFVHRDLKPGNIFVSGDGLVKLLDFGIAKILDPSLRPDALSMTRTGMYAMTPEYASPEQIRGQEITTSTDIYSLGVVLYELLTGTHPYRFKTRILHEMTRTICDEDPVIPSRAEFPDLTRRKGENTREKLSKRLRGDLDNIILKAMRKDPVQRYESVEHLGRDIENHLSGETVIARKGSAVYRTQAFIRRNRIAAAIVLLFALIFMTGSIWTIRRNQLIRQTEREAFLNAYPQRLAAALLAYDEADYTGMQTLLDQDIPRDRDHDLRGFEWRYLWRLINNDIAAVRLKNPVHDARLFEAGSKLFTLSGHGSTLDQTGRPVYRDFVANYWDLESGQMIRSFAVEPEKYRFRLFEHKDDGRIILRGDRNNTLKLWDFQTGRLLSSNTFENLFTDFVLDPRIAVSIRSDGTLGLHDPRTGNVTSILGRHALPVTDIFEADNKLLVVSNKSEFKLWDWPARKLTAQFNEQENDHLIIFMPLRKSDYLIEVIGEKVIKVRRPGDYIEAASRMESTGKLIAFGVTVNQDRFLTGNDQGELAIYQLPNLKQIVRIRAHESWLNSLGLLDNGRLLLTVGRDGVMKVLDAQTFHELGRTRGHSGEGFGASPYRSTKLFTTFGNDRMARVWDADRIIQPEVVRANEGWVFSVRFSPDGRRLVSAGRDGLARIWDTGNGKLLHRLEGHTGMILAASFSPDGQLVATAGEDSTARIWDSHSGAQLHMLAGHKLQIHGLAFSPDGSRLATVSDDQTVKFWDVATGRETGSLKAHSNQVFSIAYSPDGTRFATGSLDNTIRLWETATLKLLGTLEGHSGAVWSVQFTPDGRSLVSGSGDRTAIVWNLAKNEIEKVFKGHTDEIFSVSLSPDGRRLATGSRDKTVRIWDTVRGDDELLKLKLHTDQVWSVAFSPDGDTLASGSWDRTARLYRASSGEEVERKIRFRNLHR